MKDTGGPAFPYSYEVTPGVERHTYLGMTLRDYFAAKAMQAYLRWPEAPIHGEALIADCAYTMADAMLAERSKK
jgi:hypothetical protein